MEKARGVTIDVEGCTILRSVHCVRMEDIASIHTAEENRKDEKYNQLTPQIHLRLETSSLTYTTHTERDLNHSTVTK